MSDAVLRGVAGARAPASRAPAVGFLREEFVRLLRTRQTALIVGVLAYTVLALPFLLARPPAEVVVGIRTWFGPDAADLKLFLFVWFDLTMNKICTVAGAILASGIVIDERSKGTLGLLLSKPVSPRRYFAVKLAAACAVFVAIYAAMVLVGLARFAHAVRGFDAGAFVLLSCVHVFAGVFGVVLAGTLAVHFRHKLTAMLATILVLSLFVGAAFLGFYAPHLRTASLLNPLYHGVVLVGSADRARPADAVAPIAWLVGFNAIVAAIGVRRAGAILREE